MKTSVRSAALVSIVAALADCPPEGYTEEVGYVRCHRT